MEVEGVSCFSLLEAGMRESVGILPIAAPSFTLFVTPKMASSLFGAP
jgi:hypothetical protein